MAASAPLLLYAAIFQSSVAALLGLVGQLLLACLVALLPLGRQPLRWLFGGVLLLLLFGGVLERELSKYDWQVSDKAGLLSALERSGEVSGYGFRNWDASGTAAENTAELSLEVRLVSGQPAWDWFRSDPAFVLEPQPGADYPHTRAVVPAARPGEGPLYIMRTFDTEQPLGGRIFRVLLDIRRAPADRKAGNTVATGAGLESTGPKNTAPESTAPETADITRGDPIGGRQCRGILLQAWAYRGGGRCLPLSLSADWTRYSLSWRVPEAVDASVVRVLLSGFADETFDVRRVRLFTAKKELGPLMPQGGALELTWGERLEAQAGRSFTPTSKWQPLRMEVTRRAGDTVTAHLTSASGLVLETRNVTLTDAAGQRLPEAVSSTRQTLVFGDPNLAGHTLGTLGLGLVTLSPPLAGIFAAALTLFGLALTGSRAALVGVAGGLVWLFWSYLPKGRRWLGLSVLGLLLLGLTATLWPKLSELRLFSLGEVTARSDIWRSAWEAFLAHPLRGLGAGGFPLYWAETRGGEAVQHAHNVWLEFAVSYGVLGVLSVTLLTLGLGVLAWRSGSVNMLAFVAAVLLMNVFDTTLFYSGVLFTLFLTLGAPLKPGLTVATTSLHHSVRPGEHNSRVNVRQVPPE